ncbi:BTB/POZ domain-containing protein POB1 [Amborella trichopoda]|nr:BTB/POZ domain-containing protein POB1 [Amborella trichopoda]|eukprot:XP_011629424.1 BTB/POZ domain-containing protein POB1 [Amborella trichopoda]
MTTRAYKIRPKKEAELGSPPMLVLSFELTQKECARLFTCRRIYSRGFFLGGKEFYLMAISQKHNRSSSSSESFALYLGMVKDMRVTVDFEAFWGMSDDLNFSSNAKATLNFKGLDKEFLGFDNLFGIPWSSLMGEESPYFSNGVVRLTVVLTIRS